MVCNKTLVKIKSLHRRLKRWTSECPSVVTNEGFPVRGFEQGYEFMSSNGDVATKKVQGYQDRPVRTIKNSPQEKCSQQSSITLMSQAGFLIPRNIPWPVVEAKILSYGWEFVVFSVYGQSRILHKHKLTTLWQRLVKLTSDPIVAVKK